MKVWDESNLDIGRLSLCLGEHEALFVRDYGDVYVARAYLGGGSEELCIEKKPLDEVKKDAEDWYVSKVKGHIEALEKSIEAYKEQLKELSDPILEPLVRISDLAYDGDGYLHFVVEADGYALEGLYRLYDPANGPDMTLVSIDYGYLHPIVERQWDRIETALYERCLDMYHEILDKSEAFKEQIIEAMATAGYVYDSLESYEGWQSFYGDDGHRIGFDYLWQVAEWLDGVVFDDPEVTKKVEEVLHPERVQAKPLCDVLNDAGVRSAHGKNDGVDVEMNM